jgi:hypothetical protein
MTIPRKSWFLMQPPSDLHGPGHIARVMVWASILSRQTEWFPQAVWAAACHDLRRRDDGSDPGHGFRAGAWVRRKLPLLLGRALDGLELVASACDWHVCEDDEAEWDHPVLWLLKDADGLDRVRLYDLDPGYLRLPGTRDWIRQAQALYEATLDVEDPPRIWETARRQGLPVNALLDWAAEEKDEG